VAWGAGKACPREEYHGAIARRQHRPEIRFGRATWPLVGERYLKYVLAMRRILRCAFAVVLSLALAASGATLGIVSAAAGAAHSHHPESHQASSEAGRAHHAHHHAAAALADEIPQPSSDHPSKNCCSACTAAGPLPPAAETVVQLIVSRAVYPSLTLLDISRTTPVDPGIPKRIG